jgi:hypothetical protein
MTRPMAVRKLPEKFQVAFSFAGEQRDLVRSIAEAVEQSLGPSSVFLDEWFEYYLAGHDGDLKLQKIYSQQCELVVVCVSERYGGKTWTQTEHEAIRARLMEARKTGAGDQILPIRVGEGNIEGIPVNAIIPDVRRMTLVQAAEMIVSRFRLIVPDRSPDKDVAFAHRLWPKEPVSFKHSLADRAMCEWPAVLQLLTSGASKRILIFKGPSGFSKSALLEAALRYTKILQVPAAYLDFKVTNNLSEANVLRELQFGLAHVLPGFVAAKEPDRWALRQALRQLRGAALILLDTYEKVTETKDLVEWIETQLLAEAEECKQLRFIIGGQKVPDSAHAQWRDQAEQIELDRINDKHVWKEWIHELNPNVDEKSIEFLVDGLRGVPGDISTVLRTCALNLNRPA